MSDFLIWPLAFIFVLSVVVFVHEMGHFLIARLFSVAVQTFSIGFGPEIVGWTDSKGTRWKISWIPLGGYVKFLGDDNAASMPSAEKLEELRARGGEAVGIFHFKPLYQRALVVAAGPFANFILAIVIFMVLSMAVGVRFTVPRVDAVKPGSPGAEAGFQPGDVITTMDGRAVDRFEIVRQTERLNTGQPMTFTVDRGGEEVRLSATPRRIPFTDRFGNSFEVGDLGIYSRSDLVLIADVQAGSAAERGGLRKLDWVRRIDGAEIWKFKDLQDKVSANPGNPLQFEVDRNGERVVLTVTPEPREKTGADGQTVTIGFIGVGIGRGHPDDVVWIQFGPLRALDYGLSQTYGIISQTFVYLGGIFAGRESTDQLSGPVRIFQLTGQAASVSFVSLISLTAVLSVSIGLINLFPVPVLDGGHLVYYAYEAVRGRPLSARAQEIGFQIGLALILALVIFVTWNDLMNMKILGNG